MKRSEMVIRIAETLRLEDEVAPSMCLNVAEEVLKTIEQAGMLPPRLNEDKVQAIMSIYYGGYSTHQWDEEFEKDEKVLEAYNRRLARQKEREELRKKVRE